MTDYNDLLSMCDDYEERSSTDWMDDGWEDSLEQVRCEENYL